jgi:hypothetical protein
VKIQKRKRIEMFILMPLGKNDINCLDMQIPERKEQVYNRNV